MAKTEGIECLGVFIRVILTIINGFYLLFGLGVSGIGILVLVNHGGQYGGSSVLIGGIIVLICGIFVIVTGIMGIVGAAGAFWPLLIVYSVFIFIFFAIFTTSGALIFFGRDKAITAFGKEFQALMRDYGTDDSYAYIVNYIQTTFQCCGLNTPLDWLTNNFLQTTTSTPLQSCACSVDTETSDICYNPLNIDGVSSIWSRGCNQTVSALIMKVSNVAGGVSFGISGVQLIIILLSFVLTGIIIVVKKNRRRTMRIQNATYARLDEYPPANGYPASTVNNAYPSVNMDDPPKYTEYTEYTEYKKCEEDFVVKN